MWSSYTARNAAQLLGVPESTVRACIREGWVGERGAVPARLSFRDLTTVRMLYGLLQQGLSLARLRRELRAIAQASDAPDAFFARLSELRLELRHGHVAIKNGPNPHIVQLSLSFEPHEGAVGADTGTGELFALSFPAPAPSSNVAGGPPDSIGVGEPASATADGSPSANAAPGHGLGKAPNFAQLSLPGSPANDSGTAKASVAAPATAEDWVAAAVDLEDSNLAAAADAYRRALALRPDFAEAWVNLGRLFAEHGDPTQARECFAVAVKLDPSDATAVYNLGVVAQDLNDDKQAISLYTRALELDDSIAEAHYNLATLYDQHGDARSAIRHINEFRRLTKGSG